MCRNSVNYSEIPKRLEFDAFWLMDNMHYGITPATLVSVFTHFSRFTRFTFLFLKPNWKWIWFIACVELFDFCFSLISYKSFHHVELDIENRFDWNQILSLRKRRRRLLSTTFSRVLIGFFHRRPHLKYYFFVTDLTFYYLIPHDRPV